MAHGAKADRLKGKFSYIAPERLKSLATDCRTDIYSLGVMLYLVFTGQLPFTANSDAELLRKIVKTRPRKPSELAPLNALQASVTHENMRSRVAGAFLTVNYGIRPLGAVLGGVLGQWIGPRDTLLVSAVGGALSVLWLIGSPILKVRSIDGLKPPVID